MSAVTGLVGCAGLGSEGAGLVGWAAGLGMPRFLAGPAQLAQPAQSAQPAVFSPASQAQLAPA